MNNTAIGAGANVSTGNLTNATAIGFNATVDASNKIRLGDAAVNVIEGQVALLPVPIRSRRKTFSRLMDRKCWGRFGAWS
jgi:hypothetical protein